MTSMSTKYVITVPDAYGAQNGTPPTMQEMKENSPAQLWDVVPSDSSQLQIQNYDGTGLNNDGDADGREVKLWSSVNNTNQQYYMKVSV